MTRPTSGAPSWCSVSRRMSMYQSASCPEDSVTRPWTTARSTMSSSSRSRSGRAAPSQGPAPRDEGWEGRAAPSQGPAPRDEGWEGRGARPGGPARGGGGGGGGAAPPQGPAPRDEGWEGRAAPSQGPAPRDEGWG